MPENVVEHSSWIHPREYNCFLMHSSLVVSQHQGLFMQEHGMWISNVLIMIGGAAGNAALITISYLLYHFFKYLDCRMFWENIISADGELDLPRPKAKSCFEI